MIHPGIKGLSVFSILLCIFLIQAKYTSADIFAERLTVANRFIAINLDFSTRNSVNSEPSVNMFHSTGIKPGGFDIAALKIMLETPGNFKYNLIVKKTNGDDTFCSSLNIKILNRNFTTIYSGSLTDLGMNSTFSNSNPQDFIFYISLDEASQILQNKICGFDFVFRTFRINPNETGGVYAERKINNIISSGSW